MELPAILQGDSLPRFLQGATSPERGVAQACANLLTALK